jgi:hypothetical protein
MVAGGVAAGPGLLVHILDWIGRAFDIRELADLLEGRSRVQTFLDICMVVGVTLLLWAWYEYRKRGGAGEATATATQTLGQGAVGVQQQGSPGATANVTVHQYYYSEERRGTAPSVSRPSQRFRYPNDWERLCDLPDQHLEALAGILRSDEGKLRRLDSETQYLIHEGWAEIRQQPYSDAAVVGIPAHMLALVEEYFSEMGTLHIQAMVREALATPQGREFLRAFTDEVGGLSFAAYREGIRLTWPDLTGASLVSEHQEGNSCTFTIPDATFDALGGKVGDRELLRRSATIQNDEIEEFHARLHTIPPSAGRFRLAKRPTKTRQRGGGAE